MKKITRVHPGEILKTEFLQQFNLSSYRLAKDLSVPVGRITKIINGHRNISTETALLLARYFGLSDSFWIEIQARYDEATVKDKIQNCLYAISHLNFQEKKELTKAM